jgi:hypothetical protein
MGVKVSIRYVVAAMMRRWGLEGTVGLGMGEGDRGEDDSVYADLEAVGPGGVPVGGWGEGGREAWMKEREGR